MGCCGRTVKRLATQTKSRPARSSRAPSNGGIGISPNSPQVKDLEAKKEELTKEEIQVLQRVRTE